MNTCFILWCVTGAISPLSAAAAAAAAAGRVALSGTGVSGVLLASNLNDEVAKLTTLYFASHYCYFYIILLKEKHVGI